MITAILLSGCFGAKPADSGPLEIKLLAIETSGDFFHVNYTLQLTNLETLALSNLAGGAGGSIYNGTAYILDGNKYQAHNYSGCAECVRPVSAVLISPNRTPDSPPFEDEAILEPGDVIGPGQQRIVQLQVAFIAFPGETVVLQPDVDFYGSGFAFTFNDSAGPWKVGYDPPCHRADGTFVYQRDPPPLLPRITSCEKMTATGHAWIRYAPVTT